MKRIILFLVVAVIIVGGFWLLKRDDDKSHLIRVTTPQSGDTITSPLEITGEARGTWFFEASFPVSLIDANGTEIAVTHAEATDDWMTENFVPFRSTLTFAANPGPATLILHKDNPSGLPEHDDEIRIPVIIGEGAQSATVLKVFFGNSIEDPKGLDCEAVFPVERTIEKTTAVGTAALTELLKGPTATEKTTGAFTSLNSGVTLKKLTIENGVARADFDELLDKNIGGSCRVTAIRAQITETLKQFPTVKSVVISINGRTQDILQP